MQGNLHKHAAQVALVALTLAGCLEPDPNDRVDPATRFGDPALSGPEAAPHVESPEALALDPDLADKIPLFGKSIAYLRGYAEGQEIRYWNVDGPNANFIAPVYRVVGPNDEMIGREIIDVLPGDAGYTPWWRLYLVRTTPKFDALPAAERPRIWSRDAIEAAVELGYVSEPETTTRVYDCQVVRQGSQVQVDDGPGDVVGSSWVWYRNLHVDWITFLDPIEVPTDRRLMPAFPVYVLQRLNQSAPLYEFAIGTDLNGDGLLVSSNNIFGSHVGGERYSPLWYVALVRTEANYLSIESSSVAVGLSAEDQFIRLDPDDPLALEKATVISSQVKSLQAFDEQLVNCPIQKVRGSL